MSLRLHIYFDKLRLIDHLISRRATGTPYQLSKKLGISEKHLRTYINEMREEGCPIVYSRTRSTYEYVDDGKFVIGWHNKEAIKRLQMKHW